MGGVSLPWWESHPQESVSSIAITVGVLSWVSLRVSSPVSLGVIVDLLPPWAMVWWVCLLHVVVCSGGGMRDTALHTV